MPLQPYNILSGNRFGKLGRVRGVPIHSNIIYTIYNARIARD